MRRLPFTSPIGRSSCLGTGVGERIRPQEVGVLHPEADELDDHALVTAAGDGAGWSMSRTARLS